MKRAILTALCVLLAPTLALAAGFTANLSGNAGTGVAVISILENTISYNILVSGLDPMPISASLVGAFTTIDLETSFVGGSATGSVESDAADQIAADPTTWNVEVSNGADTLSGALQGDGGGGNVGTTLVFPVAANVTGLAGTNFVTDARLLNLGGANATVTIDYYLEGGAGNSGPSASTTLTLAPGQQAVVNDIVSAFNQAGTKGAIVATSDQEMTGSMRIYNDQAAAGLGTFGQYVKGLAMDSAMTSGSILFLSNEDSASGAGYRTNIGWFNPNDAAVDVTFAAYDADGTMLGEKTFSVAAMAQEQFSVSSNKLWPSLDPYGVFYITYSVTGDAGLFAYGSVVDNVNGDAIFVAAE